MSEYKKSDSVLKAVEGGEFSLPQPVQDSCESSTPNGLDPVAASCGPASSCSSLSAHCRRSSSTDPPAAPPPPAPKGSQGGDNDFVAQIHYKQVLGLLYW